MNKLPLIVTTLLLLSNACFAIQQYSIGSGNPFQAPWRSKFLGDGPRVSCVLSTSTSPTTQTLTIMTNNQSRKGLDLNGINITCNGINGITTTHIFAGQQYACTITCSGNGYISTQEVDWTNDDYTSNSSSGIVRNF